jgi:uncharacterized protein (TIGR03067 family)
MLLHRILCAALLLTICGAGCRNANESNQAAPELEGAWDVTRIINDGEEAPAEEIRGMRFVFTGATLTVTGPEEGPDELTVKTDPSQQPAAIDLMDEQTTMPGIYRLEDDTLTIAIRPRTAAHAARPTEFASEPGSEVSVMMLQRRPKR